MADFQTGVVKVLRARASSKAGFLSFLRSEGQAVYMGELRREGCRAIGIYDWNNGFMYEGLFNGQARHGFGRLR